MFSQFEEKGKIFTHVVTKKPVEVIFQTSTQRIEGKFFVRPDDRLIDEINQMDGFIAITDATVFDSSGTVLFSSRFLTVNRAHIIWVLPRDEMLITKEES